MSRDILPALLSTCLVSFDLKEAKLETEGYGTITFFFLGTKNSLGFLRSSYSSSRYLFSIFLGLASKVRCCVGSLMSTSSTVAMDSN